MAHAALVVPAVLLLLLLGTACFLLGRHLQRRQSYQDELSPVSRQHIDLFQGGQLSEAAVETTKAKFRDLLERGEVEMVEGSLRAGMQYVVQVRLAELGTEDAGRILERQLERRLSEDVIEQSWYWIDLANGLRSLNRAESLPHLLRCAEEAGDIPFGQFFAAETVCFLGFAGYLHQLDTPLGRAALRVLHRALEGLRCGVQPSVVAEARVGEMIENLWDNRETEIDPLTVRVIFEALRLLRRAPNAETMLAGEGSDQEAFGWQMSRLAALEPSLTEYLGDAPAQLCNRLPRTTPAEQRDILLALMDLRAEASYAVLPLLASPKFPHPELAIEVLTWSTDSRVAPLLREWALERVPMVRRSQSRKKTTAPRRPSLQVDLPYRAILRALRGHASTQTEAFLLLAARDWDPTYRMHAVSSLGWWEPLQRSDVLLTLQDARRDVNPDVRQAARAALARLGERQALQWFRQTLTSEDATRVHDTIQTIAAEGLTLLWPDLDRLADAEDADVAHHAREALERLAEERERSRN